jgi:hypothetical protein
MKGKILCISISLIILSSIFNYTYYQSKQLVEPIFLKHFYETENYDENQLTFYYLANKQDLSNIDYVQIDGIQFYPYPQDEFSIWSDNNPIPHHVQEFRHHYLRSVTIEFPKNSVPIKDGSTKDWTFEKMEVGFNGSPPIIANIGKVKFSPKTEHVNSLESRMSSSSNQHRSDHSFVATEPIIIEGIDIPFPELNKEIEIKVNLDQEKLKVLEGLRSGKEIPEWFNESLQSVWENVEGLTINEEVFPFSLEQNDWIQISSYTNPAIISYHQFSLKVKGKTANGTDFTTRASISDQPYLDQNDVDKIISSMKGGKK